MTTAKPVKLRVVLDANVYFSAFTHEGLAFWIWQQAVPGTYALLISPAIFRELGGVLRQKARWQETEVTAQLKLLAKVAEIITPITSVQTISADDDDNRILECASAGKADLIVSRDHHLRRLKAFQGIGIVHPIGFPPYFGKIILTGN